MITALITLRDLEPDNTGLIRAVEWLDSRRVRVLVLDTGFNSTRYSVLVEFEPDRSPVDPPEAEQMVLDRLGVGHDYTVLISDSQTDFISPLEREVERGEYWEDR